MHNFSKCNVSEAVLQTSKHLSNRDGTQHSAVDTVRAISYISRVEGKEKGIFKQRDLKVELIQIDRKSK